MNFNMHTKNNIRGHFLKIKSEVFQTILEDQSELHIGVKVLIKNNSMP